MADGSVTRETMYYNSSLFTSIVLEMNIYPPSKIRVWYDVWKLE